VWQTIAVLGPRIATFPPVFRGVADDVATRRTLALLLVDLPSSARLFG
jgi:hypothetical protein